MFGVVEMHKNSIDTLENLKQKRENGGRAGEPGSSQVFLPVIVADSSHQEKGKKNLTSFGI